MSRLASYRNRLRLLSALTAALLCLGSALTAQAASYVYGSRQRTINAGILMAGGASDNAPLVFAEFNQRLDIKPFGWRLLNPNATGGAAPNTAAYWEISLPNVSVDQLRQYDILYLPWAGRLRHRTMKNCAGM